MWLWRLTLAVGAASAADTYAETVALTQAVAVGEFGGMEDPLRQDDPPTTPRRPPGDPR